MPEAISTSIWHCHSRRTRDGCEACSTVEAICFERPRGESFTSLLNNCLYRNRRGEAKTDLASYPDLLASARIVAQSLRILEWATFFPKETIPTLAYVVIPEGHGTCANERSVRSEAISTAAFKADCFAALAMTSAQ
jgi:hypothetical protein